MKLRDLPSLGDIVDGLRGFLMPPMLAVSRSEQFDLKWIGRQRKWRGERT
jgi:hypothetical protein